MGILDFFNRREPTAEERQRLSQISNRDQRKALLAAIRAGKAIPDSAWSPLPAGTDIARLIDRENAQAGRAESGGARLTPGVAGTQASDSQPAGSGSAFRLWSEPQETSLDQIGKNEGLKTLFAWGIVNPFGPTLTAVATDGVLFVHGRTLPIIYLMLNPFRQEAGIVGEAIIGQRWDSVRDLVPLLGVRLGGCPTLLLPSAYREPEEDVEFYADFLTRFDDGSQVLERIRRFPGDPWKRVQEEVDECNQLMAAARKTGTAEAGRSPGRRLSRQEARELASQLLEPANLRAELDAFMYAWHGSIELQESRGGAFLSKKALPLKEFAKQFLLLSLTCRLPETSS